MSEEFKAALEKLGNQIIHQLCYISSEEKRQELIAELEVVTNDLNSDEPMSS